MTADDFLRMARELQALGASRVRAGDIEVEFGFPAASTAVEGPENPDPVLREFLATQYGSVV